MRIQHTLLSLCYAVLCCCTAARGSHGSGICCIWCAEQLQRKLAVYSTKPPLTLKLGFLAWALLHSTRQGQRQQQLRVSYMQLRLLSVQTPVCKALKGQGCRTQSECC
jgi:hypothetical protein